MTLSMRDIFLRKDLSIPSQNKYKRAMLAGFLSVMFMFISTFYVVFNRMFDIDDATARSKGSGLGLYIVKESIHKLAGSIYLKSQPGVGTTFTILLP